MTRQPVINDEFYRLVGRVVVEFGKVEDLLREFTAGMIAPGLYDNHREALLARVRFPELIEMYDLICCCAVKRLADYEEIQAEEAAEAMVKLKVLKDVLRSVNDRRNTVVHSSYLEMHHCGVGEDTPSRVTLEALKPILGRRALEDTEGFNPFDDIHAEMEQLIKDTKDAYQLLYSVDRAVFPCVEHQWKSFARRVLRMGEEH